jgi:hypothetical protein
MLWIEYLNAATMIFPSYLLWNMDSLNMCSYTVKLGAFVHMPASMLYHVMCAHQLFQDPKECLGRKWDQTFIHLGAMIYGMGSGYMPFILLNILWNEYCIYYLWIKESMSLRRRIHIYLSILLFSSPVLWHGHVQRFFKIMGYMTVGSLLFVKNDFFYGYGHSLFHLCIGFATRELYRYCNI